MKMKFLNKKLLTVVLSFIMALCVALGVIFTLTPSKAYAEGDMTYISRSWDSTENKVVSEKLEIPATATNVSDASSYWNGGWYYVEGTVTKDYQITIKGEVHLVLKDGATLNANCGIVLDKGKTLHIYGQALGTGTLNATVKDHFDNAAIGGYVHGTGDLYVYGGKIVADSSGNQSSAIGASSMGEEEGNVTIFGGTVEAKCTNDRGSGIGGNVTIYDGDIKAEAIRGAAIGDSSDIEGTVTIYGGNIELISNNIGISAPNNGN